MLKLLYQGQGMRTDVLLAKGGEVVTVNRHGDEGADKGYDVAWAMCEVNGKEGWLPRRYLTALQRASCAECKNLFGPQNRARSCHECNRSVCSICGENFVVKAKRGQTRSAFFCLPCARPMVAGRPGDSELTAEFFEPK